MELQTESLDIDELLHLAMQASRADRHDQSITYLKQALKKEADNAEVMYLLAAEHAQIGLYERAMTEMTRVLELNPGMETARFQLGLLYLTSGKVEPSIATLAPLNDLGEDNYFYHFSLGLGHLIRDEFADCKRTLEQGIALNQNNPALNQDMLRLIEAIKDKVEGFIEPIVSETKPAGGNLWLAAYQNDENSKER